MGVKRGQEASWEGLGGPREVPGGPGGLWKTSFSVFSKGAFVIGLMEH